MAAHQAVTVHTTEGVHHYAAAKTHVGDNNGVLTVEYVDDAGAKIQHFSPSFWTTYAVDKPTAPVIDR